MLADELVFSIDGIGYRWGEVIVAAWRWGEWDAVERRARHGNACVQAAQAAGDGLPPGVLETAGQEFRYARELVTAHSMQEWFEQHRHHAPANGRRTSAASCIAPDTRRRPVSTR